MALTPKQQLFVTEYLVDLDATAAAKRAGYSEKNASQIGWQLLQKTSVKEAIAEARARQTQRTAITADLVLEGMLSEARYFGEGSSHSARVSAWAHLGKHLGMFGDTVHHSGGISIQTVNGVQRERVLGLPSTNGNGNGASHPGD